MLYCLHAVLLAAALLCFIHSFHWYILMLFADKPLFIVQFKRYLNDNNNTLEHIELTLVFEFFKWIDVCNYTYGILPVQSHIGVTAICVLYVYNFEIRKNISNTCIACWILVCF